MTRDIAYRIMELVAGNIPTAEYIELVQYLIAALERSR